VDPVFRLNFPEGSGYGSTLHTVSDVHDVNDFLEEHAVLDDIDECDVRDSLISMTALITVVSVQPCDVQDDLPSCHFDDDVTVMSTVSMMALSTVQSMGSKMTLKTVISVVSMMAPKKVTKPSIPILRAIPAFSPNPDPVQ
jgi:hypothetical protein